MARGQWTQGSGGGLDTSEVTATAAQVLKGYTAGVKDSDEPQEGTLEVQSIVNFNVAVYGSLSLIGTWQNPERGPYSGVMVRYKTESYPENVDDGELAYEGGENSFMLLGLTAGTEYFFRIWPYVTTNYGRIYTSTYQESIGVAQTVQGNKTYTDSTSWTVPEGVWKIDVFCVGGGGRGGNGTYGGGGGGGGGYTRTCTGLAVTPGEILVINVPGSGGTASLIRNGIALASAGGGGSGNVATDPSCGAGGYGGSGGGGGSYSGSGGAGASNGGNGYRSVANGGSGQGTTTRAFGITTGTLYSGGGGGGGKNPGNGGNGGGGKGAAGSNPYYPYAGSANTGGGGGGGQPTWESAAPGGSGIVLIRWGY